MACNSNQTIGIPIGPDTSRLLAEVILGRIDEELAATHRTLCGIRYIDDYEFVASNRAEIETTFADLQQLLSQYELALNPSKTRIEELPMEFETQWASRLRLFNFRDAGQKGQQHDIIAYFDLVFDLLRRFPEEGLVKYAIGRLKGINVMEDNWPLFENLLNQAILIEPACIPQICDQVTHYTHMWFPIRKPLWSRTLNKTITERLPLGHASEAAWAMWLMKILDIKLRKQPTEIVAKTNDSIAALMGLGLAASGLATMSDLVPLRQFSHSQSLKEQQWLICYQGNIMNWLGQGGQSILRKQKMYDYMEAKNVSFFNIGTSHPAPIWSTGGGGGGGGGSGDY